MDILSYINKMNRLYGNEPLAARYNTQKYFNGGPVGSPTGMVTEYGRKVYETPAGEKVSEKSVTFKIGDTWINVPSIHGGKKYDQVQLEQMLISGEIQPSSVHATQTEAINAAMSRSDTMQSERMGLKPGGLVEPGVTHYALTGAERTALYRTRHPELFKTTSLEFTAKGEKIKVDVPQLRPDSKLKFKELIKGVEKWKVEPTTENWIKIFKKAKGSGKGPQQYTYGWSPELRKFLQGEELKPVIKQIFEQTDIKNVLGLDNEHVEMIKSYKNLQSPAIATRISKEKRLYASAKKVIPINNIFKTNPNITLEALTGKIHGKDFARAGKIGKVEMMTDVSNNVVRYLEALEDGREIPKGLKSKWIPPTGKNFQNIRDYIFSQNKGFRFQDQTLRDYKYAIRDSILKLKPNTSANLERKLLKVKGAADHVVSLSAVYKNAPGYLEGIQKIEGAINSAKANQIDKPFKEALELAFEGDFSKVDAYNKMAAKFQKAKNIDVPFIRPGGDPTQTVKYFTEFSDAAQKNILESVKKTGVAIETKAMPLTEQTLKNFITPESRLKGKKVMVASTLNNFLKANKVDICG